MRNAAQNSIRKKETRFTLRKELRKTLLIRKNYGKRVNY